jgi:acetylornithine deacetylase/succinyl-diaminopimelate desuccinylase-like protein
VRHLVDRVFADARVQQAFDILARNEEKIEADQIRLTMIPAPPFQEGERARVFADDLRQFDFRPITDAIGNVIAAYDGFGPNPVVLGAHLDTVFPMSTPLELKRHGRVLQLPGIADNGAGIAALLWVLRAARESGIRFVRPVIAIGNVGEEGLGNLRGVRHLFNAPPWEGKGCEFIAIDVGGMQRITQQALGSRRFRIMMMGPGGHSWADFGKPNPIHAMASAIHRFTTAGFARKAGTSFNFGTVHGGISVNAIPSDVVAEVDLRSVATSNLDEMETHLRHVLADVSSVSNVEWRIESMGERPAGKTPPQSAIVQAAQEVTRRFGIDAQLDVGSTDANIPISLGIPAIALGAGGISGGVHTTSEWFDPTNRTPALQRLLALVAVLAGLA